MSVCLSMHYHCIHYRKEAQLQIEALKEQLSGANGLVARLEAAEDESQLKIKQLQSKRDSFKRQAGELQRQLDTMTEASNHNTYSNRTVTLRFLHWPIVISCRVKRLWGRRLMSWRWGWWTRSSSLLRPPQLPTISNDCLTKWRRSCRKPELRSNVCNSHYLCKQILSNMRVQLVYISNTRVRRDRCDFNVGIGH